MTEFPECLRCPEDHSALELADRAFTERLNAAIQAGQLVDRRGRPVTRHIEGGLVRAGGDIIYPIIDQIPVLLIDEAIPLAQLSAGGG